MIRTLVAALLPMRGRPPSPFPGRAGWGGRCDSAPTAFQYVARLTGEEKHLAMVANHHPMVPHSALRAGFRLVLHGFLRELKAWAGACGVR